MLPSPHEPGPPARQKLSPRERQILVARADGRTVKEIAAALQLSVWTVRSHLQRAYRKLHARNTLEALRALDANQP